MDIFVLPLTHTDHDTVVTFSLSRESFVVIALAKLDIQYFRGLESYTTFGLEFVVFRKNEKEVLVTSRPQNSWYRSVNVELDLGAGEYVVQV